MSSPQRRGTSRVSFLAHLLGTSHPDDNNNHTPSQNRTVSWRETRPYIYVIMVRLASLVRDVSPPTRKHASAPAVCSSSASERGQTTPSDLKKSEAAAIEAHEIVIRDHFAYFVQHLSSMSRTNPKPKITIEQFADTYQRNQHSRGAHFVIHQHDHPVAGVHYDLRLQFSETSTVSWAIPYGLPGNANSLRPNRMAIETRVHNLWVGSI